MNFSKDLNERQYEAVTTSFNHVRVVAGAGSGKTRVLTYRIAYLISEMNIDPSSILAITFTNKVANEMKSRVIKMIPEVTKDLTIKTFHSFAANFLRKEIRILGYPASFTILDEEDQLKMIKDIASSKGFKKSDKIVGQTINYIGSNKLKGLYPEDINIVKPAFEDERECLEFYKLYEEQKDKMLCLDFDDLLLKTNYILENYLDIRSKWQNRIDHILIDEFQDTNNVEYKMIKLLMKPTSSLYVVGDPDQTIYTWRGANQDILLDLHKSYLDIETIILDRNYRSTQNILNSANKLISFNKMRIKKDLYTEENEGDKVVVKNSGSGQNEAEFVANEIIRLHNEENFSYKDIALLFRSSYLTLDFETAFVAHRIPYKIYGGTKFYQRREIKDVLSYFHLISNVKDDISFSRIINVPRRGIGEQTEFVIKEEASNSNESLYEHIKNVDVELSSIPKKALNQLKAMIKLIDITRDEINKNDEVFSKLLEDLIHDLGYFDSLMLEDDGEERIQNVKSLFEDIRHYLKSNPESTFDEYLQNIALLSAQDEIVDGDFVTMMTVHAAKGLEFPVVFVARFNQGVIPNMRALVESGFKGLEEERRLAYVAMTRAKKKLYLTLASQFSYVLQSTLEPSQFLKESGNEIRPQNLHFSQNPYKKPNKLFNDGPNFGFEKDEDRQDFKQNFEDETNDVESWQIGDIVIHTRLGKGVVINLEGDDIITVDFEEHGIKSIMGNHPMVSKGGHEA